MTRRNLLHLIAERLRTPDPESTPPDPDPPAPPPLPPGQRIVKVPFDEVMAARGYPYPHMRRRLAPSDTERARRAAEAALGRGEVLWPD